LYPFSSGAKLSGFTNAVINGVHNVGADAMAAALQLSNNKVINNYSRILFLAKSFTDNSCHKS
jgi:hypothetical protein